MILKSNGNTVASDVEFATTFFSQSKGLMFKKNVPNDYALVFVFDKPIKTSVHMLFVRFPIDVLFLDDSKRIIKATTLKPWLGTSSSEKIVKYIIEMKQHKISEHGLVEGEQLFFDVP
ncbi:protein of unknown function DUF192 [Methanohalobium evestigatum Z-7303]|uniref:DUF192 domain-containing protein n=1 Tax=Methanohalobium evestigatum (strain ATCC BAA-1072 / DSM 3721 / NBRC 107634 / OCM 161 / Z-7303) TaxID=644295 RepID=D7EAJ6_METEZ|nr:DUF192 domain-containing protein [Methanohalobium evestigatum]ADI74995.1 protein of unknown function DUF192 [Methanohalobium evestigatum Z-7303]